MVSTVTKVANKGDVSLDVALDHFRAGQLPEAESICRQLLRERSGQPRVMHLLGCIAQRAGNPGIAAALVQKAILLDPVAPAFHNSLGLSLLDQGQPEAAAASFRRALELDPGFAKARLNLGVASYDRGDLDAAIASYRQALDLDPTFTDAHLNLGIALMEQFRLEEAVASLRRALEIDPSDEKACANLGGALASQGKLDEAIGWLRKAIELKPGFAAGHSNLLFTLHYLPTVERERHVAEAMLWNEHHATPLAAEIRPHDNRPDPGRRLRIGYVSADFHRHPVGYFLEAILRSHDKSQVEVFCYSNHRGTDDLSRRLRAAADNWRMIVGVTDSVAATAIRRDAIDILVDLSGHTGGNRLGIFARKPAPVQATWVGYFGTTGLSTIDYIILDRHVCPPGDERYFTEDVVRLPECYLCYAPQTDRDVAPLPALDREYLTFGCFNKAVKINSDVVALWSRILAAVPRARLCLKDTAFEDRIVRDQYQHLFASHGVMPERLILLGRTPFQEHLDAYSQIDLALDPFPFNGGTTTVEALWMGVPVVTLAGDRFVSRMGVTHLTAVGLPELIAETPDDYVRIAADLARDMSRLAELRQGLRQRMAASPLCDAPRFTRGLEQVYREMWQNWCARAGDEVHNDFVTGF